MINDIAGPLLGALRTAREVERLADAVEQLPDDNRHWPCWTAPWPSGTSGATTPDTWQGAWSDSASRPLWLSASGFHRPASGDGGSLYLTAPAGEGAGAVRPMLCGSDDTECNRLCSARRSDLAPCDGAAGFDDRELFELLLEPRHRSPLYRSSLLAARFALSLTVGEQ